MALDFPSNTSAPYIDPVSGLKYIFNPVIGAWEAAIQPPAVISDAVPAITIPGFLWWDSEGGSLYIYYQDADGAQWVEASPGGAAVSKAVVGFEPPESPVDGELWWNSERGNMFIYYNDGNSSQWIQTNTYEGGGVNPVSGTRVLSGASAPIEARAYDLWYNTTDNTLYVNHKVADAVNWVKAHNITNTTAVTSVSASGALSVTGTTTPSITVREASAVQTGVVRLSDVTESNTGTLNTVALSPGVLSETIGSYLSDATDTAKGVVELATTAETAAGGNNTKAVTPAALKAALPTLSTNIPVGGIIQFGGALAPTGYLKCDGAIVSRTTYADLFAVIGTIYGIGDGVTTFKLPNISGTPISCIKH